MAISLLHDDDQIVVKDADLVEGGDKSTTYTIRKLTPEKQRQLRKANTRKATYGRTAEVNWDAVQDDQIDHILAAWTGVVDRGTPVPCTREFKLRMDPVRKNALLDAAGLQDVVAAEDAKQDSFRPPA